MTGISGGVVEPVAVGRATVIVRETIADLFPAVSVFQYESIYVPASIVFTVPDDANRRVPLPSLSSVHRAPGSENVSHTVREIVELPFSVTTGARVSTTGGVPPHSRRTIPREDSPSTPEDGQTAMIFPSG